MIVADEPSHVAVLVDHTLSSKLAISIVYASMVRPPFEGVVQVIFTPPVAASMLVVGRAT